MTCGFPSTIMSMFGLCRCRRENRCCVRGSPLVVRHNWVRA
jgi:hypothetical protein